MSTPRLDAPVPCQLNRNFVQKYEGTAAAQAMRQSPDRVQMTLARIKFFCASCPLVEGECRKLAGPKFSGVAGGKLYVAGRSRSRPAIDVEAAA